MPELPEVETIRRGLERLLIGYTITGVEVRFARIFSGDPSKIINAKILAVKRFGKGLLIELDNDMSIAIHVKMTGQLIFKGPKILKEFHPRLPLPLQLPNQHTHVIFTLKVANGELKNEGDEAILFYNDIRKFGWMKVVLTKDAKDLPFFKNLGFEPLNNLTIKQFNIIVKASKAPLKSLLMDQQKIAGIGNIYANDALFAAGIDPRRNSSSLTKKEIENLFHAIELVLRKGIDAGGASDVNYLNVEGGKGSYQNHFLVYKQNGKPCKNCGTEIQRIKLAGRGTFFCPVCQS
ncbi:MAG: bifunctional DNA-formamidopyrimidine glycosylase/DNA-(apurinic or apyrimidinic site) lyase [Candidatus Levyibacteriota bacterium]